MTAFCTYPKNVPKAKFKSDGLISRLLNIDTITTLLVIFSLFLSILRLQYNYIIPLSLSSLQTLMYNTLLAFFQIRYLFPSITDVRSMCVCVYVFVLLNT